ncbi:MAG: hypothetical protein N4A59_16405, partial [Marinifilum sp.]|nr:hypothetical protein [Marinifilum sp.]
MAKKLTDDMLKWTLEVDGKPAQKSLGILEQKTKSLEKANRGLAVEMQKLKKKGKENTKEFKELESQYKENNKTIRQSKARMKELREEIGLTGLTSNQLKKKVRDLQLEMDNLTPHTPEWNRLNNELKVTNKRFSQVKAGGSKLNSMFGSIKKMLPTIGFAAMAAGAYQGLKRIISGSVQTRAEFSKYEAMLINTLGSQKLANAEFAKLQKFAAETPFQLSELTNSYVKLSNYGLQPTMDDMRRYGDLSASLGKSFDQYVEAIADATQFEFERLKEFGIRAKKQGDKIKFTFKGITTEVNAEAQVVQKYLSSLGDMAGVAGGMEKISKRIGGALSNSKDATDALENAIGKRLEPTLVENIRSWTKFKNSLADYIALKPSEKIQKEQDSLNVLVNSIISVNDNQKLRNDLIAELEREYPSFISNLNSEKVTNRELLSALKEANKEYLKRIKIAVVEEDLAEANKNQHEVQKKLRETVKNINAAYDQLVSVKKENATLDEKLVAIGKTSIMTQNSYVGAQMKSNRDLARNFKSTYDKLLKQQSEYISQYNVLLSEQSELGGDEEGTTTTHNVSTVKMTEFKDDGSDEKEMWKELDQEISNMISNWEEARQQFDEIKKEFGLGDDDLAIQQEAMAQLQKLRNDNVISLQEHEEAKKAIKDTYKLLELEADILYAETDGEEWAAKYALVQKQYDQEFAAAEGNRLRELKAKEKFEKNVDKINKDALAKKQAIKAKEDAIREAKLSSISNFGAQFAELVGKETALGKVGFLASKAKAISDIIISTQVANAKAVAMFPVTSGQPWVTINTIAGAMGVANVAKQVLGFEEGGFTNVRRAQDNKEFRARYQPNRRGFIDKPTVLVGENGNEFVSNAKAVSNPTVKPFLDVIDAAQRAGTIETLNLPAVMNSMAVEGRELGGYTNKKTSDDIEFDPQD